MTLTSYLDLYVNFDLLLVSVSLIVRCDGCPDVPAAHGFSLPKSIHSAAKRILALVMGTPLTKAIYRENVISD
jgi:hypothetical protein